MAKHIIDSENLGTLKIYKDEVSTEAFKGYSTMFNAKVCEDIVEFNTINLNTIEVEEEMENAYYENKKMGEFLELLGFSPDDITSYIINGSEDDLKEMIMKARK